MQIAKKAFFLHGFLKSALVVFIPGWTQSQSQIFTRFAGGRYRCQR